MHYCTVLVFLLFAAVNGLEVEKEPELLIIDLLEKIYGTLHDTAKDKDEKASDFSPQVKTSSGTVIGVNTNYSNSFYAIPFAIPPVGDLRFQAPQMLNTPDLTRILNETSRIECYQFQSSAEVSEDCLVLNIHVPIQVDISDPDNPPNDRLPVMLFMHGGAYHFGAGTITLYEGKYLSQAINAIIVTINYRLGPFGFLSFDENGKTIEGNQGLKDQQLAMQWVQNNIEKFGGDKTKVTIFGESAGAQSVMFHLVSNNSDPLFHQAIMQSNPAVFTYPTLSEALETTDKLIGYLRCNGPIGALPIPNPNCCPDRKDNYTCIMDADPETLISTMAKMMGSGWIKLDPIFAMEPFRPYIDGTEYIGQPLELFREGKWQTNKPIILGTNAEEVAVIKYIIPIPNEYIFRGLNEALFESAGKYENTGERISEKYIEMYGPNITDYGELFGIEMTDIWFGCPSRALARYASRTTEESVYFYIFSHALDVNNCEELLGNFCGYSYHGHELFFVFRTIEHRGFIPDDHDIAVSDQFSTYWGSFARTGSPSGGLEVPLPGNFQEWYPYSETSTQNGKPWVNMRIDDPESYQETDYLKETCDFWDSLGIYADITNDVDVSTMASFTTDVQPPATTQGVGEIETTSESNQPSPFNTFILFTTFLCSILLT
uniref:crystal protein-like n=1 Tax=Styela clava TaxID=7725 RepID=UPI00193A7533|nr:crystal protein-like [Styela clava]